jgi:hypothetical protein
MTQEAFCHYPGRMSQCHRVTIRNGAKYQWMHEREAKHAVSGWR